MSHKTLPSKICAVCGRTMEWRKKWEKNWDAMTMCSDACRKSKNLKKQKDLEDFVAAFLRQRLPPKTACPSEIAREWAPDSWRDWMEPVRQAARRLCARGFLEVTQYGQVMDASTAKGAIRLRLIHPPRL